MKTIPKINKFILKKEIWQKKEANFIPKKKEVEFLRRKKKQKKDMRENKFKDYEDRYVCLASKFHHCHIISPIEFSLHYFFRISEQLTKERERS